MLQVLQYYSIIILIIHNEIYNKCGQQSTRAEVCGL
jgi:hypothetical protein